MISIRIHIIFWVVVTILLTGIFGKVFESFILSFYFVAMLLPVAVGTSYFFNYFLVPRYLLKKRYKKFTLYFIYLLIISTWLEMWVITGSFVLLADLNADNLSPVVTNIFLLAIVLYFVVFLKAFLLLIKRSYATQKKTKLLKSEKNKFLKGYLTVRADRRQAKILFEDIHYIESMGDYVKVITESDEPVITRERISHIIKELPETFLRIHRSFIVNSQKVAYFSKTEIEVNGTTLPISRTYKNEVNNRLSQ
ncbi:MAG: LytTR family transcriptional regulator [Balneolaceae bacterium]|nr:LytTR family transcriptional regulator [Balneolaceae bacterium]